MEKLKYVELRNNCVVLRIHSKFKNLIIKLAQ